MEENELQQQTISKQQQTISEQQEMLQESRRLLGDNHLSHCMLNS
jgi:hypothetical protein